MSKKPPDGATCEIDDEDPNEPSTSMAPVRRKKSAATLTRTYRCHPTKSKFFTKLSRLRKIDPGEYETLYMGKGCVLTSNDDCARNSPLSRKESNRRDKLFVNALEHAEFRIKEMLGDGSCFFRSVADQIYGDQEYHDIVRAQCMDYIDGNKEYFSPFITENFDFYVKRKRMRRTYANNLEIQAVAELYKRPLEMYFYNAEHINNENAALLGVYQFTCDRPDQIPIKICYERKIRAKPIIQVSYHKNNHYNSLIKFSHSVASQTRKLGKEERKSLAAAEVESATSYTGVRTPEIKPREMKEKKKEAEANSVTTTDPATECVRMGHQSLAREVQESESTHKWMAAKLDVHKRFLKDTLLRRAPWFYSSPYYRGPRNISKATFASTPVSISLSSLNIAPPSPAVDASTSAATPETLHVRKSSSSIRLHTPLETTPTSTRSNGKPLKSIVKRTLYDRIFHSRFRKTSNDTSCFRCSSSTSIAIDDTSCFRHGSASSIAPNDPHCFRQSSTCRRATDDAARFRHNPSNASSGAEDDATCYRHSSTSSLIVPKASSYDKNKAVEKDSKPTPQESLHRIGILVKPYEILKKRDKKTFKDMRDVKPVSSSASSESMPRLLSRRKGKKKQKGKSIPTASPTEATRINLGFKKDMSNSTATADVGSSSDESD